MNNIEMLHTLYIVTLVAAIIMLVATAVLFFVFRIWHVIGYMLGFSEKKAIREMETDTNSIGRLNRRNGVRRRDRVYTTTGSLEKRQKSAAESPVAAVKPPEEPVPATSPLQVSGSVETTPLAYNADNRTVPLTTYSSDYHTGKLKRLAESESARPKRAAARTAELSAEGSGEAGKAVDSASGLQFSVIKQIMYIHTEECIL